MGGKTQLLVAKREDFTNSSDPVVEWKNEYKVSRLAQRVATREEEKGRMRYCCSSTTLRRLVFALLLFTLLLSLLLGAILTILGGFQQHTELIIAGTILLITGFGLFLYSCCTTSHYSSKDKLHSYSLCNNVNSSGSFKMGHTIPPIPESPEDLSPYDVTTDFVKRTRYASEARSSMCSVTDSIRYDPADRKQSIADMMENTVPACLLNKMKKQSISERLSPRMLFRPQAAIVI